METHNSMKTTLEISDAPPRELRKPAAQEGVTPRSLVGADPIVSSPRDLPAAALFKLRRASFKGKGRQPEFVDASWESLRDRAYEDRDA
jgi:hypothetical protein